MALHLPSYNTRRLHSVCGFKSPIDYENGHRAGFTAGLAEGLHSSRGLTPPAFLPPGRPSRGRSPGLPPGGDHGLCRAPGDITPPAYATSTSWTSRWRPVSASPPPTWHSSSGTAPSSAGASPARAVPDHRLRRTRPSSPSPAIRLLFAECLDLITTPLLDEVRDRVPAALYRLRAMDQALRDWREDRHRVDALLSLIADLVEDYADRATGQKP